MERNHIIGFILIFATLLAWMIYTKPSDAEIQQARMKRDSIEAASQSKAILSTPKPENSEVAETQGEAQAVQDSAMQSDLIDRLGIFAPAGTGESGSLVLENEKVKIEISAKGGYISSVLLKEHVKTVRGTDGKESKIPVVLMNNPEDRFEYLIPVRTKYSKTVSSRDLYFEGSPQGNTLILRARASNGGFFEQKYVLRDNDYTLDYSVALNGLSGTLDIGTGSMELSWLNHLSKYEKSERFEQNYSTIYYKKSEKDPDYCKCVSDDTRDLNDARLDWISHSNQFFNASLISRDAPFDGGVLETRMTDVARTDVLKILFSRVQIPLSEVTTGGFEMAFYTGPNEFNRLRAFGIGLEEIIPFGSSIFGTINRWMIRPFFEFLSRFISSKGIVIIVLIFLIKMMLYPLMYKMLYSQAKMGALKPELTALKEKYKDDMQKQQLETMKMYREYGVSPLGGCLPMLLQMPIWYALFRFFPASITFRQEPFLWATDLSTYDVLFYLPFEIPFFGAHVSLFTLLWTVSTLVYTYYNMQNIDLSANPAMKYVQYIMPVMFLAFFNNYASGLTVYMFFSNLINILQTVITKNYIFDESKIRAQLLKEKEKPKKKSGFQARLEEAMRQQQAIQEQKKQKK